MSVPQKTIKENSNLLKPKKKRVKFSRYRPGVAQRVGRGIPILFHDRGTRRGCVVSSTPQSHTTPWKDPVPLVQKFVWGPWPVWTGGKSHPHGDSIPDRPARSQSLNRLSYAAHNLFKLPNQNAYVHSVGEVLGSLAFTTSME